MTTLSSESHENTVQNGPEINQSKLIGNDVKVNKGW